jgi:ribosome-associated protein
MESNLEEQVHNTAVKTGSSVPVRRLPSARDRAILAARIANDHKAKDILILDLTGLTPLFDFFVLCTGNSRRQLRTIAEEVDAGLRAVGDKRIGIEGYEASQWILQDYGDVVVHVFEPSKRVYYELEELWADAGRVPWEPAKP